MVSPSASVRSPDVPIVVVDVRLSFRLAEPHVFVAMRAKNYCDSKGRKLVLDGHDGLPGDRSPDLSVVSD